MTADPANPEPTLVDVRNLSVAFQTTSGRLSVLININLQIRRGEVFGLVGESGSGKTTLAYQLLGYRLPNSRIDDGSVLFSGIDLLSLGRASLDQIRGRRISFVPQNPTTALSPGMHVGRQVREVLRRHFPDWNPASIIRHTADLFRQVGLPDPDRLGKRYPHQLSGGQQQRVCIAMALACDPDLIVLDEPTTGLDVTTQAQIVDLLKQVRQNRPVSMLFVTHDLALLSQLADRIGVMYAGRLVEIAPMQDLFYQPSHPYTRGLIASIPGVAPAFGPPLRGSLNRSELPAGCAFTPRCRFAEPSCGQNVQPLRQVAEHRLAACQRWSELPPTGPIEAEGRRSGRREVREPVLVLSDVDIGYGKPSRLATMLGRHDQSVIRDLSLSIEAGEILALVGESGSGKSTVARAISGLLAPRAGEILFEGAPLPATVERRTAAARRRIQYIFQNPDASLNPRRPVRKAIGRAAEMFRGAAGPDCNALVTAALSAVRLDEAYAERFPDELSGGERQRIAIARAIVAEPILLLCDEILSALDVSVQAGVLDSLRRLRSDTGVSILFISHDLAVVRSFADRVAVLFRGGLVQVGPTDEVFHAPQHPYTRELISAAPSLPARPARRRTVQSAQMPVVSGGCIYASRCGWKLGSICESSLPPWRPLGSHSRIRCHRELEDLAEQPGD